MAKSRDIPIDEIDEFPDHPFKVLMNEDMEQLVDSNSRLAVTPIGYVKSIFCFWKKP